MVNYLPPYQTELIEESEQTDYLIQEEKDGQNDSAADHHTHPLRPLRDAAGHPHPRCLRPLRNTRNTKEPFGQFSANCINICTS